MSRCFLCKRNNADIYSSSFPHKHFCCEKHLREYAIIEKAKKEGALEEMVKLDNKLPHIRNIQKYVDRRIDFLEGKK